MGQTISMEVMFFLTSVLWGAFLLVIYDVIRIIRRIVKHGVVSIAIEDILFWIVSAVLIFRMMYERNDGIIRGFSVIGIVLGMVLYKYSISEFMVKIISTIILTVIGWIKKFIHIITGPLRYLEKKIYNLYVFLKQRIEKRVQCLKNGIKKLLSKTYGGLKTKVKQRKIKSKI